MWRPERRPGYANAAPGDPPRRVRPRELSGRSHAPGGCRTSKAHVCAFTVARGALFYRKCGKMTRRSAEVAGEPAVDRGGIFTWA